LLNKVLLIGNLTRDVEIRYSQGGLAIAKFGLAVNRRWKDRNTNEDREETLFVDINVFGRSAEIAHQYLSKGRQTLVEGRLVLEQWTDQNGQKRSRHSISAENIQFLGGAKNEGDSQNQSGSYEEERQTSNAQPSYSRQPERQERADTDAKRSSSAVPNIDINDEELPF
jgi:single-strand DNA-binding protein